jgi:hypothetical protein
VRETCAAAGEEHKERELNVGSNDMILERRSTGSVDLEGKERVEDNDERGMEDQDVGVDVGVQVVVAEKEV